MKTKLYLLFPTLVLFAGSNHVAAQNARFFRISGPAAASITAFRSDGTMVWTNAQPGTNYIVQTATVLPGGTNWVNFVQLPVTRNVNTNQIIAYHPPADMAFIPAGSFAMGDSVDGNPGSDAAIVTANVSAFYMDVNLVTLAQWQTVYFASAGYQFDNFGSGKDTNQPVQTVSWFDAVKWCNARSQQAGLAPVYFTDAALTQIYTNGDHYTPFVNWTNSGYRLPTEAEQEKAARGGLSGQRFPWGSTISESLANYYGNTAIDYDLGPNGYNAIGSIEGTSPATSPVGSFPPNGYGLYDMAGNVWKWCWDWYGTPYAGGNDPTGISGPSDPNWYGYYRVVRGGDWGFYANIACCAFRDRFAPTYAENQIGFRCVRKF